MAIIVMLDNAAADFPEGAYCDLDWSRGNSHLPPAQAAVVLHKTHVGLCISDREANGYDDSDWFMMVWDPVSKCASEICFASTRGWTYPCYASSPDATPEVMAEYKAWAKARARAALARKLRSRRACDMRMARECGMRTRHDVRRLRDALGGNAASFEAVIKLLKTRKFRSEFRAKLCQQVRDWLANPAPRYATPLSTKQLQYV